MFIKDAQDNYNLDFSYIYGFRNKVLLEFGDPRSMDEGVIAYTDTLGNDNRVHVVVNPELWEAASPMKRIAILYHELGHDILNLEHRGEKGPLMSVYARSNYTLFEFYELRDGMFRFYIDNLKLN